MSSLEKLYENLNKYSDFEINDNTDNFLNTVDKIVEQQIPSSMGVLLEYFEDDTEYSWVFESISSAIEHYTMETYIDQLFINLSLLLKKAPIWADNFFNRIFNHSAYLDYFKRNMCKAQKEDLLKLFNTMERESPHHKDLIAELRKDLQSS